MEIVVEDLEYVYNADTPLELKALDGISLTIPSGSVLAVLGASGSGKTTFLKTLNGLLNPTAGRILIDGCDTKRFGPELRKRVGLVFQQPERQVFEKTVFQDISFVLTHFTDLSSDQIRQRVGMAAALLGLDIDVVGDRAPWTLSDGERRRVAIAGVVANNPDVLILDEPTVGLGPESLGTVLNLIRRIREQGKRTVILVSHQIDSFLQFVDKIVVLDKGTLAASGTPAEVCATIGHDPAIRPLLPEPALLLYDLRNMGLDLPADEYDLPTLAKRIVNWIHRKHEDPAIVCGGSQ